MASSLRIADIAIGNNNLTKKESIMKKFYTLLAALGVTASMAAQQLPNAGFDTDWVDCYPWSSKTNINGPFTGSNKQGTTPKPWCISNVYVGTGFASMGNKTLGSASTPGFNESTSAVNLKDVAITTLVKKLIPAYITLGTSWSTSEGTSAKNKAGGAFGGADFSYRPDALSFQYKNESKITKSNVIAYMWKGTFTQKDVPANIVISGSATKDPEMLDRDRQVLGMDMTGCQGGETSQSDDALCIAKLNASLDNADNIEGDWKQGVFEFEYADATALPEKINVIFSAGDYFDSERSVDDVNNLIVDDVKLVYYSRLSGLKFKDNDIADFNPDQFEYELDEVMPTDEADLEATTMGNSGVAKAAVELDQQNNVAKITVTNDHGNDADDQNSHVYTVKFLPAGSSINDVNDMTAADVRYVDLYGNAVAADALVNGQTYIKLVNGKATKVIANN